MAPSPFVGFQCGMCISVETIAISDEQSQSRGNDRNFGETIAISTRQSQFRRDNRNFGRKKRSFDFKKRGFNEILSVASRSRNRQEPSRLKISRDSRSHSQISKPQFRRRIARNLDMRNALFRQLRRFRFRSIENGRRTFDDSTMERAI